MGQLVEGVWQSRPTKAATRGGGVARPSANFRNWITADGSAGPSGEGGFAAESGRYHLYVSYACPWAHRVLIFRKLKGLDEHIGVSVVHPDVLDQGWEFRDDYPGATGDKLHGLHAVHALYSKASAAYTGRASMPVLWDSLRETMVSNESSEIIRMFNSSFDEIVQSELDFMPVELRKSIEPVNARIYETLNNGVYKAGFAQTQEQYDAAIHPLFDTLDWLDARIADSRYLMGERPTEADWRLFPTLVRFDSVYHLHFKCNRKRIVDYPNLWAYARELFQWPGVAETVRMDHIVRHYHFSHDAINPFRIVPINPVLDWNAPHGRG